MTESVDDLIQRVKAETDYDRHRVGWIEVFRARGHKPVMERGGKRIDFFVTNPNGHNGPGCKSCEWTRCMHCCTVDQIPECTKPVAS